MPLAINSNILIGLVFIMLGISSYISLVMNRYQKNEFRGKIVIGIIAAIVVVIGLLLFICGIVYEWPNLINF